MSGLNWQTVDVKFTQGIDGKTSKKLVVPGKWDTLVNVTLSEDYALKRRDGYEVMVNGVAGNGLAVHDAQLLVVDGGKLSTVSTAPAVDTANEVQGRLGYVGVSKDEIRRSTGMQDTPDCASNGSYTCYVWRDKSPANVALSVNVTLVDETTGAQVISNVAMRTSAAVFGPRVIFSSSDAAFFIFYIQGTSLYCRTILVTSPTVLNGEVALVTSASLAALNFDACPIDPQLLGDPTAMVAYGWADGVTSVRSIGVRQAAGVPAIASGPTNLFTEAQLPIATLTGLAAQPFSNGLNAAVFATSTGAAAMAGLAGVVVKMDTQFVTTAATQLDNAVAATTSPVHVTACRMDTSGGGTGLQVFWDRQSEWATNALSPLKTVIVTVTLTTPVLPQQTLINSATFGAGINARGPQGPFIAGKAFNSGGKVFLPVCVVSVYNNLSDSTANPRTKNEQNVFLVLEVLNPPTYALADAVVVGKALYGSFGFASINGTAPTVGTPCSTPLTVGSNTFAIAVSELTLLVLSSGNNVSPSGLVRLTLTPNDTQPPLRVQLGETTFFAGGSLAGYDGVAASEVGFPLFPEGPAITVNGAGTGAMTAGVHQVVFVYEWVDNAGQRFQSAPSLPISVTVLATGSLTCEVPSLLLSQKGTSIQVVAYMTQAGGLTFNRVLLNNGAYAPVMNTLAATTVTLTIDDADATIAGNALLYTQPNQAGTTLPNFAPGPVHGLGVSQERLWYFKSDQRAYGFSQKLVPNLGLQFSPDLGGDLPSGVGEGVAIAAMDEKTVLFCERKLFVVSGSGPNPGGGFNNFSEPEPISSDVGCSDARSVLETPMGLIFKSSKGWQLLRRDLSVEYIGDGAAAYDAFPVNAAVLMGDEQEARFTLGEGSGPEPTLVYSYANPTGPQWSVFFMESLAEGSGIVDAVWWPTSQRYVHLHRANAVFPGLMQDTPGVYVDGAGTLAPLLASIVARTGFLHMSALEAFQRVRWLFVTASSEAAPTTNFGISVDVNDVYAALGVGAYTVTAALGTLTFPSVQAIDLRHKLQSGFQKCKSVAFTFVDSATAGDPTRVPITGLQAMALEVGLKKGVFRLPAGQTL